MATRRTELHILTEYSPFSMGFVLITPNDRAIIIDGGRVEELPNVAAHVGNRPVAAWILTHPHGDHAWCFQHALKNDHPLIAATERVICNFHSSSFYEAHGGKGEASVALAFEMSKEKIADRLMTPVTGDVFEIDGLKFEVLFHRDEKYTQNCVNDSSLVFRVTGTRQNVLFLGDLGPIAGRDLLAKHGSYLRSDVVQMAHHGHMCVEKDVYEAIDPRACIWCAQSWLYNEGFELPYAHAPEMHGTGLTRQWMKEIGVTEHYVTKDGDQVIMI